MSRMEVKNMRMRLFVLLLVFTLACGFLLYQVGFIIYAYGEEYGKQVVNQTMSIDHSIPPMRGSILDRNNNLLAYSSKVYNVILDPFIMYTYEDARITEAINNLSELSGVSGSELQNILENNPNSRYKIVKKSITLEEAEKLRTSINEGKVVGVWLEETSNRVYPNDQLAAHVIGFEGGGTGHWGVEETYDEWLQGAAGRQLMVASPNGMIVEEYIPAVDGNNLVLTIDETIQHFAEEVLYRYVEEQRPLQAGIIIMDPHSGEILTMANYPSYNLNDTDDIIGYYGEVPYNELSYEKQNQLLYSVWRNFNISDSFEPGSTYKPLTYAIALEENLINMDTTFYCPGQKFVAGIPIGCWKDAGHGELTVKEALAESCNVAVMEIAQLMNPGMYYNYQQAFGIGQLTNIDLIGEFSSAPLVYTPSTLGPVEMATTSFGQGFNVTPIQLITANAAVINGGYLYEPHLVKQIVNEAGVVIKEVEPTVVRKVVSEETSDKVSTSMEDVVEYGTAKAAQIEGYDIAGKTGTAQKGDRDVENYTVSFLSYAPADDPEVIMLVVLDEPKDQIELGSRLPVQISKEIYEYILPYMGVYPNISTLN